MAKLRMFQIDAFTSRRFGGNPAAVVPLESWLDDELMQSIALENNLSETAFFVPEGEAFRLRWFTPTTEVKLCGHATLASAHVLFEELDPGRAEVAFLTLSGRLDVRRDGERIVMDLPAWTLNAVETVPAGLVEGLRAEPTEVLATTSRDNLFAVFEAEADIRGLVPDSRILASLHPAAVAVTAPGDESDCSSRYFAPSYGIPEDPATGSIHCGLAPYWARRLGKRRILARQVSPRGGELDCEPVGARVLIGGAAVRFLEGWIEI